MFPGIGARHRENQGSATDHVDAAADDAVIGQVELVLGPDALSKVPVMLLVLFGPGPLSLDGRFGIRDVVVSVFPKVFANQTLIDRVMLVARLLIAFPFLADVVKKTVYFAPQRAMFVTAGLPGDAIHVVMLVELVCGLALIVGWGTRQAAIVLLAWSVVLAVTIHNPGCDLAIFGSDFGAVIAKNFFNRGAATFFKDVTTVGALCVLIVYGPGAISRDARSR
jgi:putative oxidoreductase